MWSKKTSDPYIESAISPQAARCGIGLLFALLTGSAFARLGETETELLARFGPPQTRNKHSIFAQGKFLELGPSLNFKQDDWSISSDLADGRCVRIHYAKPGDWTEEQIQLVLAYNSQGAKWAELTKPGMAKLLRTWKRADGAVADWAKGSGMKMVVPAYEHAKQVLEAKAQANASRKPKI